MTTDDNAQKPVSDAIPKMDVAEFRRLGFLQEINRRLLHPLGLAIEVNLNPETGEETLGSIWDYRADPEGLRFDPGTIDPAKARAFDRMWESRALARQDLLGYVVQPIEGEA